MRMCAVVALGVGALGSSASELSGQGAVEGDWKGVLDVGVAQLRIVFHITGGEDGLTATMDSPDQGASGIPVPEVTVDPPSVVLGLPAIQGRYEGELDASGDTIHGTWSQGPQSFALDLTRGTVEAPPRPQEPTEPVPYSVLDVTFPSVAEGVTLAGTLTTPRGQGPWPAAVLVSGSGPQDRNETLVGHRPFLVLADHLTRQGIAVLRYDDRGVAESGGDFATATSADFALDAEGAVRYLQGRSEVDPARVGVIGHSEGGLIAPMVATSMGTDLGYIVLLAGPGISGEEILALQQTLILEADGADPRIVELAADHQRRIIDVVREEQGSSNLDERLRARFTEIAAELSPADRQALQYSDESIDQQVAQLGSPWFAYFLFHDPAPVLERVRVPVLAINGAKDLQVPAEINLTAIERALRAGGNPDVETRSLEGLNHLFQTAGTGAPSEYASIEETFSPVALEAVSAWIRERFGSPAS